MVDEYLDEREQAEQLRQWFKENWLSLVTGVALGLGGLYGWQAWNAHLDRQSQQAGQRFGEMLQAFERDDRAAGEQIAAEIADRYGSTPYADQTTLVLARLDVEGDDLDKAAERLRAVMEGSDDPELALVARIRLARVQMAQGQHDAALATLDGARAPAVDARLSEVRGDILYDRGDHAAAREAYRQALAQDTAGGAGGLVDGDLLRLKLDELEAADAGGESS